MKFFTMAALAGSAVAYPGMKGKRDSSNIFRDIIMSAGHRLAKRQELQKRQGGPPAQPFIQISNLQPIGSAGATRVNNQLMTCLGVGPGRSCVVPGDAWVPPEGGPDVQACTEDQCCIWSYIKDDLVAMFTNADLTCNDLARAAVRFGFHDAAAWHSGLTVGGADGSLLLSETEVDRPANAGLRKIHGPLREIYQRYQGYGITAADLVQFAHNVAVVVCPLGPRGLTYIGRPDVDIATVGEAPDNLLPDATAPAQELLDLFLAKTIQEVDLVALLGAHSTAKQFSFDLARAGQPLDSTPGIWDVAFYAEILNGTEPCGVFHLPSDVALGQHDSSRPGFVAMSAEFPLDTGAGQVLWNTLYAKAYTRMSLMGVADAQHLVDCSHVLPAQIQTFDPPADAKVTCDNPHISSSSSAIPAPSSAPASSEPLSSVVPASPSSSIVPASPSAPASVHTFSSFSHFANTTRPAPSHAPTGNHAEPSGNHPEPSVLPSGSKNGGGDFPRPSGSHNGNGSPFPSASKGSIPDGDYGNNGGHGSDGGHSGPKPTSKPSHGNDDGSYGGHWGTSTSTYFSTKTVTITKCGAEYKTCPYTTTEVVPTSTRVCEGLVEEATITKTRTSTITVSGKVSTKTWEETAVTTSINEGWSKPVVTKLAEPAHPAACQVKTVTLTSTVWA